MASPLTVWSGTADGRCFGSNASYSSARSTATNTSNNNTAASVAGQWLNTPNYIVHQCYFAFDTSTIGYGVNLTTAQLSFYGATDGSVVDFDIEARRYNWTDPVGTDDYVAGDNLTTYTKLATFNTANWSLSGYNVFTSEAAFLTNIAQTGTTRILTTSSRTVGNYTPDVGNTEWVEAYFADDATGGGGTDRDPKLYVEWTAGTSPLTVWSSVADGAIASQYTGDYVPARTGTGATFTVNITPTSASIGQYYSGSTYYTYECFLDFPTSSIDDGANITTATLSLYGSSDQSTVDFTSQVRIFDWGGTLTSADWRSGDPADANSLDEYTLVGELTSVGWNSAGYNAITSNASFLSNVSKTGTTYLIINSDRLLAGNTPTGLERVGFYTSDDNTGGGGTDRDPKLYVEYSTGIPFTGMRITRHLG